MFYCLVVGSRIFDNYEYMCKRLDYFLSNHKEITIVSGEARGADTLAKQYAHNKGYKYIGFPANWSKGKSAGYIRNKEMHKFISQHESRGVVAFWDGESKGTAHNFELAKTFNNPIRIIEYTRDVLYQQK